MEDEKIVINEIKNSGLVLELPKQEDWVFGGVVGADSKVIFPEGHGWLTLQSEEKMQKNKNFDSFSCVTFASLKALVYYFKAVHGISLDLSEMFTAVMSGTIPNQGNSVRNVLESIRNDGWLNETDYPFTENMTQGQFFSPVPFTLITKAKGVKKKWLIKWETVGNNYAQNVDHEDIIEALKHSPVIVTGFAWASYLGKEGVYYDYNNTANHCFLAVDYDRNSPDYLLIADDSYPLDFVVDNNSEKGEFIKKLAKSYRIWSAHKITVEMIETKVNLTSKIKEMFRKISRDAKGGLWFIKKLSDGSYGKQKIESLTAMMGALVDEVGVEKNNLTDAFLNGIKDINFFGK